MLTLTTWLVRLLSPLRFLCCIFWKEVPMYSLHLRSGELWCTYLSHLEFFIDFLSPPFIHAYQYLYPWIHECLFYILCYNPILFYSVPQIVTRLAIWNFFSWPLCLLSFWHDPSYYLFLFIFLNYFFGITRCSSLILYISYSNLRVSSFSKEPGSF